MNISKINSNKLTPIKVPNFKSASAYNKEAKKYLVTSGGIDIPDLFKLENDLIIDKNKLDEKEKKYFEKGIEIETYKTKNGKMVKIFDGEGEEIFAGYQKNGAKCPIPRYCKSKFSHNIVIEDGDTKIMMLAGSKIQDKGGNFQYVMQGEPGIKKSSSGKSNNITFTGNIYVSTLNKEVKTLSAVEAYSTNKLQDKAPVGDYKDLVEVNNPSLLIPAGGFGERFSNVNNFANNGVENKPSCELPTHRGYRIIGTTLNMGAGAGIITGKDKYTYLSQNHELIEGGKIKYTQKYGSDGGAFAEGLKEGIIPSDKDAIILNADIFTNADISRTYHALKTLPNAALVIPYYRVNAERAKSFGLIGGIKDENGNTQIEKFIEKPKYTNTIPKNASEEEQEEWKEVQKAKIDDKYMANPGMYFLSKEALQILKDLDLTKKDAGFLGKEVIPKIVQMAQEGKILNEKGEPMKVYTVPLEAKGGKEAFWDDIGSAEAYVNVIQNVAIETKNVGLNTKNNKYSGIPSFVLNDFMKNTDTETGVVSMTEKAQKKVEHFKNKYDIETFEGNILIS